MLTRKKITKKIIKKTPTSLAAKRKSRKISKRIKKRNERKEFTNSLKISKAKMSWIKDIKQIDSNIISLLNFILK